MDPDSLNPDPITDPDPAFQVNPDPVTYLVRLFDADPDPFIISNINEVIIKKREK